MPSSRRDALFQRIVADGKQYEVSNELRIPPHVRDLSFDYTALSLAAPDKVRFRFKLDGQDPNWREVINVRQVQYSNLPPGGYRFRVIASNNSGVWNETGDTLEFSIEPAYYQTNWFRALLSAVVLIILWGGYRYRLYRVARQFNACLESRVDERLRVARELHDTLLQSFQAALFEFQRPGNFFSKVDRRQSKRLTNKPRSRRVKNLRAKNRVRPHGRDTEASSKSPTEVLDCK